MYNLKITGLTAQQDMQALVKVLLQMPGLNSESVARGLKVPPLAVLSAEREEHLKKAKTMLEKLGAICVVEDTNAIIPPKPKIKAAAPAKKNEQGHTWFLLAMLGFIILIGIAQNYLPEGEAKKGTQKPPAEQSSNAPAASQPPKKASPPPEKATQEAHAAKNKNELKEDLSKNPYNTGAWKALYEKLEKEGDTVSASRAKDAYDKALKAQMVLASLAKAFGNDTRVEITEGAVYYRTSKDINDSEFYYEAEKLRESVNAKFPDKDLVLENYRPDNRVQTIRLKGSYSNKADQPSENDSPK